MHPVENIRGTLSHHLEGKRIVLAVAGSIAAVKTVELARELIRHGADVIPVMSDAATRILHPDALEFATGHKPVTRLTGAVEHVALLGDVPEKADLLLIAPATANSIAKMALGIDDTPVTTCATVAFGTRMPVVIAPAMHEAMLDHPVTAQHQRTLVETLGATWVEPERTEKKAKLADTEAIVEAVIHRLAQQGGPLAGKRALVISGSTAEPIDPVRILTNRSSGRTGHLIATELRRLGADVALWQGGATEPVPAHLEPCVFAFTTHKELSALVAATDISGFHQVWMPAAIGDYGADVADAKISSEQSDLAIRLKPLSKIVEAVRKKAPKATLISFKAESDSKSLLAKAKARLQRYGAQFIVANSTDTFGAPSTTLHLVHARGHTTLKGQKEQVIPTLVALVALARHATKPARSGAARTARDSPRITGTPRRRSRVAKGGTRKTK